MMRIVELSGGVGGARMARGLAMLEDATLTVVVNVGDDAENHGLAISPDLDTVVYTLAGEEGPMGWGRRDDTFNLNEELGRFGIDNRFRLGDRDLALKLYRTNELARSIPLTKVTAAIKNRFGVTADVLPATDQRLRTNVRIEEGWLTFQEYFVDRGHADPLLELRFEGTESASPAPGALDSIADADLVVIGPSNPPLSIWPILAIEGYRQALVDHPAVVAVSPLIGGKALKGPADRVLEELGLGAGNAAVARAYEGLIDRLVIDSSDANDAENVEDIEVTIADTLITDPAEAHRLAIEVTR